MTDTERVSRTQLSLDELLACEMMVPVLKSAGYDRERFFDLMVEIAERVRRFREKTGEENLAKVHCEL